MNNRPGSLNKRYLLSYYGAVKVEQPVLKITIGKSAAADARKLAGKQPKKSIFALNSH
jgi:hypothetical protein